MRLLSSALACGWPIGALTLPTWLTRDVTFISVSMGCSASLKASSHSVCLTQLLSAASTPLRYYTNGCCAVSCTVLCRSSRPPPWDVSWTGLWKTWTQWTSWSPRVFKILLQPSWRYLERYSLSHTQRPSSWLCCFQSVLFIFSLRYYKYF